MILAICITCTVTYHSFFLAIDNIESPPGIPVPYPASHVGSFQISYAYWLDSGVPGKWKYCLNDRYAKRVMVNYWRRYVPEALRIRDFETLARTHYGGPNGAEKESTKKYWKMIKDEMDSKAPDTSISHSVYYYYHLPGFPLCCRRR